MTDELDCYVLVTIEGPFGEVQQVSGLMRPSEAAMTAASIMGGTEVKKPAKGALIWLKAVRVVQTRRDVR